ncbi:hypothetical protein, partial [Mesorhizobium sp. LNHC229A00]|uniref:hypothetical protein n=1 Tax=Mesorhizobium sp. LNHC229A00 TaxID=1287240 RepID=UPI001AEC337E
RLPDLEWATGGPAERGSPVAHFAHRDVEALRRRFGDGFAFAGKRSVSQQSEADSARAAWA